MRAIFLALLLAVAGCEQPKLPPPDPVIPDGEAGYRTHCAACHGLKLEGQPDWRIRRPDGKLPAPPHDDSGHTWHHSPEQLFAIIKYGMVTPNAPPNYESDMPAFDGKLTDYEIRAIIGYIRLHWSPQVEKLYQERFGALASPPTGARTSQG